MNHNFAENLKKIRKENNLSQEQLAEELGVSRQAISKWESAVAYPEMDKIIALCDKFNLNLDDLLHKDIKEVKIEEENKTKINKVLEDFLSFITDTISLFSNMSFKSKIKCLFEQALLIGILFLVSIILKEVVLSSLTQLLFFLPRNINSLIINIFEAILEMFCFLVSLVILIHLFKTRYLNYYIKLKDEVSEETKDKDKEKEIDNENKLSFKENQEKIIIRDPKHSEYSFIKALFKLIIGMIKFFSLWIGLFLCFTLIFLSSLLVLSFLIWKTGLFFIGLLGSLSSLIVITTILLLIFFNFVFNRQNNKKRMIFLFLFSVIVFGISSGLILIGCLDFEVEEKEFDRKEVEIEMEDTTFFHNYQNIRYIEDNRSNIKIEYQSAKYCEIEFYDNGEENGIYIGSRCSNPTKIIKEVLKDINNKKIFIVTDEISNIVVYTSGENIEKMNHNREVAFQR